MLSVVSSVITQRDEAQIDLQTEMLTLSLVQFREQSIHDHLTTLFNRRYLEETLERELQRAGREQRPLGLIMLDIDHFKARNDTLGHAAGDRLLQALGHVLQADVRGSDFACRYGGEEFVLVLPDASRDATTQRAERLREDIGHLQVEHAGKDLGRVTVSLGVAVFPDDGHTVDAILRSADAALYRAKDEGRNRVAVASA
jgi:diguanylate cyclase (GGDEF)-like protein